MSQTRNWSKWAISLKRGIPMFAKESFINKPEVAVPLVGFPLCMVGCGLLTYKGSLSSCMNTVGLSVLGIRYYLRNKDIDEVHKYKSQYTIVRYEDLKNPDRSYFN